MVETSRRRKRYCLRRCLRISANSIVKLQRFLVGFNFYSMAAPTDALFWKKTSTLMAAQATIPTLLHAQQVTFTYLQL